MEDFERDAENVLAKRKTSSVGDLRLESAVVFPVVNTSSFIRYEVPRGRGILNSDSEIQFGLKKTTAGAALTPYYCMLNGIAALVDKCVLRIDDKIVATCDKFGHLISALNPLLDSDQIYSKDEITKGYQNCWKSTGKVDEAVDGTDSGKVRFDTKRAFRPDSFIRPASTDAKNPKFSLKLSDLFPGFMKHNQLPLFVMENSSVFIEISLNTDVTENSIAMCPLDEVALTADDIEFDADAHRFFGTFLFYDDRVMNAIRSKYDKSGLTFTYHDYSLVEKTLAAASTIGGTQEDTYEIGGAGHVVRHILIHKNREDSQFYGKYSSQGQFYKANSAIDTKNGFAAGAGGNTPGTQVGVATTSTGKGSGCVVTVIVAGGGAVGAIGDITITSAGAGYKVGDTVTLDDLGSGAADVAFNVLTVSVAEGKEEYQLEVNDERIFQRDQNESAALGFHYAQTGDKDLYVPQPIYSTENLNGFPDTLTFAGGAAYSTEANGKACPRGFNFMRSDENVAGNGVRVGHKQIRLTYKHEGVAIDGCEANVAQSFKIWLAYERQFALRGGEVMVSY